MTVLPNSTVNITWTFDDEVMKLASRVWSFTNSDSVSKRVARIIDDDDPKDFDSGLSGVSIVKPATLLLKNVNQTYDGTYRFILVEDDADRSDVVVFIASKYIKLYVF